MKKIYEMSKGEILALSNEEIKKMVDYVCAERGIPLLPLIPVKPDDVNFETDTMVYEVCGITFIHSKEAEAVQSLLSECTLVYTDYVPGPRYDMKINGRQYSPSLSAKRVFSEKRWEEVKDQMAEVDKELTLYKEAKKEYDDIYLQRADVVDEIMVKVNDVWNEQQQFEKYTSEYNRYLELAGGDNNIATNFFEKVYPGIMARYSISASEGVNE